MTYGPQLAAANQGLTEPHNNTRMRVRIGNSRILSDENANRRLHIKNEGLVVEYLHIIQP